MNDTALHLLVLSSMDAALRRSVSLDPNAASALKKLSGKQVDILLEGPNFAFRLAFTADEANVQATDASPADASIAATPGTLAALSLSGGNVAAGKLKISGDALVARDVEKLFRELKPDFAAGLAPLVGDLGAVQAVRAFDLFKSFAGQQLRQGFASAREYVRDESRDVISQSEFEQFAEALDDARDRVARLEARLAGKRRSEPLGDVGIRRSDA
jgi:ubiquinone biosynthesis accessory factor UbiJ